MKYSKIIICILVIALISFSLISCSNLKTEKEWEALAKNEPTTTQEAITTIIETTITETTVPETTVVTTAETATETTTGVITASGNPAAFKDALKKSIEADGSNMVTKITFSDDGLTLYLNYNNTGAKPELVEMQMYVNVLLLAANNSNLNVALNGTWRMMTTYHSYTSTENMVRLKNMDLSYEDWLKVAIQ